jgi:hypothetical protein
MSESRIEGVNGESVPLSYEQEVHALLCAAASNTQDLLAYFEEQAKNETGEARKLTEKCIEWKRNDLSRIVGLIPQALERRDHATPSPVITVTTGAPAGIAPPSWESGPHGVSESSPYPVEGNDTLRELLQDANEVCRSAYQIAARGGKETNWPVFTSRIEKSLKMQQAVLFPETRPNVAASSPSDALKEKVEALRIPHYVAWNSALDAVLRLMDERSER